MKPSGPLFHWFSVIAVTAYMVVCACWLMARGKIDPRPVLRTIWAGTRRKWRGPMTELRPELGKCWLATVAKNLGSDADIGSRLVVLEDGVALGKGHCFHDEIRKLGKGRYSHWADTVYFAPSDDSDPRSNGRVYTAEER